MTTVTNAVLEERLKQQKTQMQQLQTQMMLEFAQVGDKLEKLNGSVKRIQVRGAEHEVRIARVEKSSHTARAREDMLREEIKEVRQHTWRTAIAIALVAGVTMGSVQGVLGLVLP